MKHFQPVAGEPLLLPLLLFLLVLAVSCSTDAYDKGDGKYSRLRADMVELYTNAEGKVSRIVTDENEELAFSPFTVKWAQRPDTIYRAYLYYNMYEREVDPISAGFVATLPPHQIDTLKTDPVVLESLWLSTSRRYVNMGIYVKVGSTGDEAIRQVIGIAKDTLMANADGTHTLHLQFYHDQAGVPEYYSQRIYISIPTDSLAADTVCLRINTYDGVVEKRF